MYILQELRCFNLVNSLTEDQYDCIKIAHTEIICQVCNYQITQNLPNLVLKNKNGTMVLTEELFPYHKIPLGFLKLHMKVIILQLA